MLPLNAMVTISLPLPDRLSGNERRLRDSPRLSDGIPSLLLRVL